MFQTKLKTMVLEAYDTNKAYTIRIIIPFLFTQTNNTSDILRIVQVVDKIQYLKR